MVATLLGISETRPARLSVLFLCHLEYFLGSYSTFAKQSFEYKTYCIKTLKEKGSDWGQYTGYTCARRFLKSATMFDQGKVAHWDRDFSAANQTSLDLLFITPYKGAFDLFTVLLTASNQIAFVLCPCGAFSLSASTGVLLLKTCYR